MSAEDVSETLDKALAATGVEQVHVRHRPRLLSDNVTPADVYHGRHREILTARQLLKMQTLRRRRCYHRGRRVPDEESIRPAVHRESVLQSWCNAGTPKLATHKPGFPGSWRLACSAHTQGDRHAT